MHNSYNYLISLHPPSLTLGEIQEIILVDDDHEPITIVAIEPPIEEATADTDCDFDASDNEVACNPNHLPRRILLANVLSSATDIEQTSTETGQVKKNIVKKKSFAIKIKQK